MTPLADAKRNVRRAWLAYYGGLTVMVALAALVGAWTDNYYVTVPVALVLGAVLSYRTSNRLLEADTALAAAEQACRDRYQAGKAVQ